MKRFLLLFTVVASICLIASCKEKPKEERPLRLAQIFTDNMVLQRDASLPVWGWSTPNEKVQVQFRGQQLEAQADTAGEWRLDLAAEKHGKGDSLVVTAGTQRLVLHNVAVGEVWICSGQSNMEMNLDCSWAKVANQKEEVAAANFPDMRLFVVERSISSQPLDTMITKGWQVCTPETAAAFSAVGYFFGRDILAKLNVPVGLIQTAWGGTTAEAWTSQQSLAAMADFSTAVEKIRRIPAHRDSLLKQYDIDMAQWTAETLAADPGYKGSTPIFASPELDDSQWKAYTVPGLWEQTEIGVFDGTVWFRKHIRLTAKDTAWIDTLCVAAPDDADETFLNGQLIGESNVWDVPRRYAVPKGLLRVGDNVVAVRLSDFQGGGGFMGNASHFALEGMLNGKLKSISLASGWKCHKGYDLASIKTIPMNPDYPNTVSVLYNGMVHPLVPFAMRGVIWYQGESNSGRAYQYRQLFSTLIQDWRKAWNNDFAFLFVQLANFMPGNTQPVEDAWAELREAQALALKLPNTGMACAIDIGDANDIHPANKQDVGKRLALVARHQLYSDTAACYGPTLRSLRFATDSSSVTLHFEHTYGALRTTDNKAPIGFAVADAPGKFQWAKTQLAGDSVVIVSPSRTKIRAIRYAWSSNPAVNLVNAAGLPAPPFRTDTYKGVTQP